MKEIKFVKMVASGNDFIIVDNNSKLTAHSLQLTAKKICDRKFAVGADGLLVLEKSKLADIRMRIFNADGSEAEMCGNGARCAALYQGHKKISIETKAGIIKAEVKVGNVKIKLTDPKDLKLDIPIKVNERTLGVNFINTGVPHTVIFVEGIDKIDVFNLGREIRYYQKFAPKGTNVDFVEVLSSNSIKIRTYERGVEDETLACGTGAVAASLISKISATKIGGFAKNYGEKMQKSKLTESCKIDVYTKTREVLKVYFDKIGNEFQNVWLEGKAKIVYQGVYYV